MNMGKTNKCNLREVETLAEVVKNTNVCQARNQDFFRAARGVFLELGHFHKHFIYNA